MLCDFIETESVDRFPGSQRSVNGSALERKVHVGHGNNHGNGAEGFKRVDKRAGHGAYLFALQILQRADGSGGHEVENVGREQGEQLVVSIGPGKLGEFLIHLPESFTGLHGIVKRKAGQGNDLGQRIHAGIDGHGVPAEVRNAFPGGGPHLRAFGQALVGIEIEFQRAAGGFFHLLYPRLRPVDGTP